MKSLLAAFFLCALASPAFAQAMPNNLGTFACNRAATYDASTSGATQLVAANGPILICGYTIHAAGTANISLVYGTGTNCAAGQTKVTPAFQLTTGINIEDTSPFWRGLDAPAGQALCINSSAAVAVQAIVYYAQ